MTSQGVLKKTPLNSNRGTGRIYVLDAANPYQGETLEVDLVIRKMFHTLGNSTVTFSSSSRKYVARAAIGQPLKSLMGLAPSLKKVIHPSSMISSVAHVYWKPRMFESLIHVIQS